MFAVGQFLGNQIMGRLSDRIGRKPVVMMSIGFSSLGYGLLSAICCLLSAACCLLPAACC
jgi:MFS family permease